ncbi:Xaa-Pro dipeptidase [Melghiribacillus thermohalophilus]|uniref:Xaa-Pro dipeptidase n=1 Tax=Melghiribacillus thermohalophilus TaxID=1324956 RepID=A0A4R3N2X2_9BACI|nr:Xaa-Pro dipeptidase [Melghiribacillus thermohalophilus]
MSESSFRHSAEGNGKGVLVVLSFELAEYQERLRNVKEKMAAEGIDVLLVSDPANMNYLSGYDAWSFYVHQLLIIILDEDQPFWVGRGMDAKGAEYTTWLDNNHIIPYADHYVHSESRHPMDFIAQILTDIGQSKSAIGVEMDAYYFTAACMERLRKGLPDARFKNANVLVNWVRLIKSPCEIQYIRKAAILADLAMQKAVDTIDVGVRECDVVANIYHAQISGTDQFGGDYPAIVPMLPSGEQTSTPHLTWSDSRYKVGDSVIIELAGCYKRYHCPMARTVVLHSPTPRELDLSKVVLEGLNETLDSIKPGMTCEEVERIWRKSIEKNGYQKESRIGYSTGLSYPPDWGERTASLRPGDLTILEPNMVFHLIPGIWLDDCGVEISQTFRVTENGIETLTCFPRKFIKKDNGFRQTPVSNMKVISDEGMNQNRNNKQDPLLKEGEPNEYF